MTNPMRNDNTRNLATNMIIRHFLTYRIYVLGGRRAGTTIPILSTDYVWMILSSHRIPYERGIGTVQGWRYGMSRHLQAQNIPNYCQTEQKERLGRTTMHTIPFYNTIYCKLNSSMIMRRIVLNLSIYYYDIYIYFTFPSSFLFLTKFHLVQSHPFLFLSHSDPCLDHALQSMDDVLLDGRHRHQPVSSISMLPVNLIHVSSDIINPPTITIMHGCELSKRISYSIPSQKQKPLQPL